MIEQVGISERVTVEIQAAPVVICSTCKKRLGMLTGQGERVSIDQIKFDQFVGATCPHCQKQWVAIVDGAIKIKTDRGLKPWKRQL